jgi:hypothetical protein
MNFFDAIKICFIKYADFTGCARLPMRSDFLTQGKSQELMLSSASHCAWLGAEVKNQRRRFEKSHYAEGPLLRGYFELLTQSL